jgi:hypothetical protein
MIQKINLFLILAALFSCTVMNRQAHRKEVSTALSIASSTNSDTAKKASTPKPYKDVITAKAITDDGLFKVHNIDGKYFFEIPDSLFERDLLIVSRVAKGAVEGSFEGGDEVGESLVRFSKGPKSKIFLQMVSHLFQANDSSENGMYRALQNSSVQPIVAAFDISAYSPDSSGVVIDMTGFLNSDNNLLYIEKGAKNYGKLGGSDAERSYIIAVKSYPINLEITTVKTYNKEGSRFGVNTYQLTTSIVLLPKAAMKTRYFDRRVGYFYQQYGDLDLNPQQFEAPFRINRWRMEPRPEDVEKYKKGELVEPAKPIVYYIDPATPKKWVPYLIQGVNDWQKAFEKAGFKHAIYALEAPKNDSTWSLFDATHNAIIYKASATANASGPHVHDPRSGEILETHIEWYHNVMSLLHDWYMLQAGNVDPRARKMEFDDNLMGQLIRFVSSHEVGHTLGLMHNFGASSTIPVEKLRDKQWVEENGFCPSIMDYARFNYVAQPEDHISEKGIFPRIGVYDEFAIEWGYRWFDQFKTREEEQTYLNNWVIQKTNADKRLWFGMETLFGIDARAQSEDLGDDPVMASTYGIRNLKQVMPQLMEWTREPNQNYDALKGMYSELIKQYKRYIYHVFRMIGSVNFTAKMVEQSAKQCSFTPARDQRRAVQFLASELLSREPEWLTQFNSSTKTFSVFAGAGPYDILLLQDTVIGSILSFKTLAKLTWFENTDPDKAYTVQNLFSDMEDFVWDELKSDKPIDYYKRFVQKSYVSKLNNLLQLSPNELISQTDMATTIRINTQRLYERINRAIPMYKDPVSKAHLVELARRLKLALNPNARLAGVDGINKDDPKSQTFSLNLFLQEKADQLRVNSRRTSCFDEVLPYDFVGEKDQN